MNGPSNLSSRDSTSATSATSATGSAGLTVLPTPAGQEALSTGSPSFRFLWDARRPTAEEKRRLIDWAKQPRIVGNLVAAAALFGLFIVNYFSTFANLISRWNSDENYSHGYLVPVVSLYLLAQNLKQSPVVDSNRGGAWLGGAILLFGLASSYVTILFPSLVAECFSMLLVLAGAALLLGGWEWQKRTWVPIAFLLFMAPWPSSIYSRIAFPLQQLVCEYAAVGIDLVGVPVLREGNILRLPNHSMHVAQACSGLRQLTAFLAICTCAVILMPRPAWYRGVLFASAIPIAVFVNILRVIGTGLVVHYGDAQWAHGTMHTLEGLVMVGLGMGLLWMEIQVLDWVLDDRPSASAQRTAVTSAGGA